MLDITWAYDPAGYFEGPIAVEIAGGELAIADGTATFRTSQPISVDREAIATFTSYVRAAMNARLLATGGAYSLSEAQFVETDEDGHRRYTLFVDSASVAVAAGRVDFIVTNADGSVKRDTRAERVETDRAYLIMMTARAATSPSLRRMLASYSMSYSDPANALVYLYEVRDAAAGHFGGATQAQAALEIPSGLWSRLGELSNNTPIREGRHRGRQTALRPATTDEIADARGAASAIINAFANSL